MRLPLKDDFVNNQVTTIKFGRHDRVWYALSIFWNRESRLELALRNIPKRIPYCPHTEPSPVQMQSLADGLQSLNPKRSENLQLYFTTTSTLPDCHEVPTSTPVQFVLETGMFEIIVRWIHSADCEDRYHFPRESYVYGQKLPREFLEPRQI